MNTLQKKSILLIFVLVTFLSLTSCQKNESRENLNDEKTSTQTVNEEPKAETITPLESQDYDTYSNSEYGVELQYPKDYKKEEGLMGTTVFLSSPLENSEDKFQENFNLVVQDLSKQPMTLKDFTELSENQIKSFFTDVNISTSEDLKFVGQDAHKIIYTGKQGDYELKWQQIYFIKDNKAYILTFTADASKYDNYNEVFQKMINSFKYKN